MEIIEGGEWNLIMHGPDGTDYKNKSVFREIVERKKIVYEHFTPNFTATIEFESRGNQTLLSWHMLFATKEEFLNVVKTHKADEGLKQNIEKLAAYLQTDILNSKL